MMSIVVAKMHAAQAKTAEAAHRVKACLCHHLRLPAGWSRPGPPHAADGGPPPPRGHRGHHGHHGHHGHRHHRSAVRHIIHAVKRVFAHVLLPIMVGVMAGMAACAVGMLVGQIAMFVWLKVSGRGGQVKYTMVEDRDQALDAKDGLPAYEDLEAAEVLVVVDDEKKKMEDA